MLDGNQMSEGYKYFRLGNIVPSPDQTLLAYSVDYDGDETYTARVKNLVTGEHYPDEIPNTYYSLEWANDNRTFFYTVLDEALRPYKILRHTLGESENTLVYHETDERFALELSGTRTHGYILIHAHSPLTSEVLYLDADNPRGAFLPLLKRTTGVEYDVAHWRGGDLDTFFVRLNDTARGFRVIRLASVTGVAKGNWTEIIPGRDGITIESITAFRNFLVSEERHGGLVEVHIREFDSGKHHAVTFPEPAYSVDVGPNYEFASDQLRFVYTSLVTAPSHYDYDMSTCERVLVKQQPVLGGYDPSQYQCERFFVNARDGVQIPVSLVYQKGFVRDGAAPMLLYGYGSYGISMDASFRSDRLSLLNRGFVYAIAHIRGGMDMGKPWHEEGRLLVKMHTFEDFVDCARHLVANRYTSSDRLGIMGGSAGGLLMGAVSNLAPELFRAVVAMVPFVDSLNTALDPTLPLTIGEYEEFGNPQDKVFYDYMKAYAPYENVRNAEYPAILATAGLNDPRVSYWEPAKWIAKLREHNTGPHPILLKTNMGSGHFGSSGRYDYIKETALHYAFLLRELAGR